jgi:hypothetical protein
LGLIAVRSELSRARLLGGCSLLCFTLGATHPTFAQERRNTQPADSFYERFHISLEGGLLVNESANNFAFSGSLAPGGSLSPGRNGSSFGVEVGGAFNPLYDWRARWRSNTMRTATGEGSSGGGTDFAQANNALRFYTFDGEFGYRPAGTPLRLFAGARVLKARESINYGYQDNQQDKFGTTTTTGNGTHEVDVFGIGPRAGMELTVPFPERRAYASLNGSVAAIFANRDHTFNGAETVVGTAPPSATITPVAQDYSRHLTIFNAEATAMFGYRLTNNASFEVGYRMQYFSNMLPQIGQVNIGNVSGAVTGDSSVLVHGPLAKLTIAWP